jgi:hypothetical protein
MQHLLPIENPRGMAGLAKQKFAGSYTGSLTYSDPTDHLNARTANAAPTYCHLMHRADDSGLLVPPAGAYISADMPLAQKKAIAAVRLPGCCPH